MAHNIKPGVATGDQVQEIFRYAKEKGFALPAVNVTGSSTINGVLETAAKLKAPVIIQFSNGGASFNAGKGLSNDGQKSAILGAVAGAKHIHTLAEAYGATVILHTDHCAKNLLPLDDSSLGRWQRMPPRQLSILRSNLLNQPHGTAINGRSSPIMGERRFALFHDRFGQV